MLWSRDVILKNFNAVESLLSIGAGAVAGEKNRSRSKTDRLRNSYGEDRGGNK